MTDEVQKYRNKALHLLKYRPRSTGEITKRLKQAGASKQVCAEVVTTLLEHGLLDDLEFARWVTESRLKSKHKGSVFIKYELKQFGVDNSIIKKVLSKYSTQDYLDSAVALLEKKLPPTQESFDFETKNKAYRLLSTRGFSGQIIRSAIDAWQANA